MYPIQQILYQFLAKVRRNNPAFVWAIFVGAAVFSHPLKADTAEKITPNPPAPRVENFSDPAKTYRTFLEAIKADDLAAAKACCTISDDNKSGSLDVLVGMWVTFHHFNKTALLHFNEQVSPFLKEDAEGEDHPYLRRDCTDAALDRTIARLAGSKFTIEGNVAKLTIAWEKDDGSPQNVFLFSEVPLHFRKIDGHWKFAILTELSPEQLVAMFKPGSWFSAFRDGMNLQNSTIKDIESKQLKTWQEVTEHMQKKYKELEEKWIKDCEK